MILLSLYFRYITKDWLGFQIYGLVATGLAFVGSMIAPESPKYLFSYKQYREAKDSLRVIARYNRVQASGKSTKYMFDTEVEDNEKAKRIIPIISSTWSDEHKMNNGVVSALGNGNGGDG